MTHVLIVSALFYPDLADEMSKGAIEFLASKNVTCDEVVVPGAFEIPAAIRFAAAGKKYEGFIALGCVIRGETTHYDYVCAESARALMDLSVTHQLAIGYGILTVENEAQAWARARISKGNKGAHAAEACLRMISLKRQFGAV